MNWLFKFSTLEAYKYTTKELFDQLLFHGTCENIIGNLKPGGDGLFWMAESPAIAQTYIPEAGATMIVNLNSHSPNESIRPDKGFEYDILQQMVQDGYALPYEIKKWNGNQAMSWSTFKSIKYSDLINYIENVLGYQPDERGFYRLKLQSNTGDINKFLRKDDYKQGNLYMLIGKNKLKIKDISQHGFDLSNPAYLQYNIFRNIEKEGYDGVRINDYAQTDNWGNLGHISIGIFKSAISKLQQICIPAKNHIISELSNKTTEEFKAWHKQEVEKAFKEGKEIPESVLAEYGLKQR